MDNTQLLNNAYSVEKDRDNLKILQELYARLSDNNGGGANAINNIPIVPLRIDGIDILGNMAHREHELNMIKRIIEIKITLLQAAIKFYDKYVSQFENPWSTDEWISTKREMFKKCNI